MTAMVTDRAFARTSGGDWQERGVIAYPLLIALGLLLVVPAALNGPLLHDSFAISWVWADQFTALLREGTLYPRWLPLSNGGLGAPVFYYYPPLAFYLTGAFGLAGLSTYDSMIAAFAAAFALSGVTMWHWLRGHAAHPLIGAVLFMAAPYHLFDYAVRGALAETLAIALIPLVAIGLRQVRDGGGGTVLALAYAALIMTHLPLALLASLLLIAPYALWHRGRLLAFAPPLAIGIALAAIYLVPALALEPYRDVAQLYRRADLNPAYWSLFPGNWHDGIYATMFAMLAATVVAAMMPALRRDKWALYAIAIAIIAAGLVPGLWSLPLVEKVQFPYRALPLAEFAAATAIARLARLRGAAVAAMAVPLALSATIAPGFGIAGSELARLQRLHPDVREYLPPGVAVAGRPSDPETLIAERRPPPAVAGKVVTGQFWFPAFSCGVIEPRTKLLMHAPECRPELRWTAAERVGAGISLAGLLMLLVATWWRRRRRGRREGGLAPSVLPPD